MSLLMRRKSSQPPQSLSDESLVSHLSPTHVPPIPDNYDPSIRGRIVHDFSAPRPNRNFSYNNAYTNEADRPGSGHTGEPGRVSPQKIEREHTPVFREHFDDDTSYEQSQAAIRAEKLANNDFVARNSWMATPPAPEYSPPPPPPLPKDSPPPPPPQLTIPPPVPPGQASTFDTAVLSPVEEAPGSAEQTPEETPRKRKSTKTLPSTRSRATSITDNNGIPAFSLAHHTSKSSRFSFQIAGSDAAQEKILEERHKQKAAEKASQQQSANVVDDEYDEYGDMDDYDMDGGYEEEIPMVGEDDFDDGFGDGFGGSSMPAGLANFDLSSLQTGANNASTSLDANGEPQIAYSPNGLPIGYAISPDSTQIGQMAVPEPQGEAGIAMPESQLNGLGITNADGGALDLSEPVTADSHGDFNVAPVDDPLSKKVSKIDLGDDFDFDDGMIEEQGQGLLGSEVFDEDVFDDPAGPLFERRVKPPPIEERRSALCSNPPDLPKSEEGQEDDGEDSDDLARHLNKNEPALAHAPSMAQRRPIIDYSNLDAYHGELAAAAQRAEADGRFVRKPSVDMGQGIDVENSSDLSNSRPSLIPDDGRPSEETANFSMDEDLFGMSSGFIDDYDVSEYDSALEDDVIAEANAQMLATDYDDFYGSEFGFYARAQGESETAYGGYFGSSGIGRSTSGRNAVREPNLTPITERSEYSTRNSFISVNHFRDGQQPLSSPGLAQLARMSPYGWTEDDNDIDMSMDTLMKLRKGAFGSNAASLGGSPTGNSPRNSSPMGFVPRTSSAMANHLVAQEDAYSSEALETDDSALEMPIQDREAVEGTYDEDDSIIDAVNATSDASDDDEPQDSHPESPTLNASDYSVLSSPPTRDDAVHITIPLPHPPQQALPPLPPTLKPLPQPLTLSTTLPLTDTPLSSPACLPPSATNTNSSSDRTSRPQSLGLIPTTPATPGCNAAAGAGWKPSHSRKTSTADSVAYIKECDELGGERWVLERRRTAESGELELVGREIVEGGRI